jgi:hypothetical protein
MAINNICYSRRDFNSTEARVRPDFNFSCNACRNVAWMNSRSLARQISLAIPLLGQQLVAECEPEVGGEMFGRTDETLTTPPAFRGVMGIRPHGLKAGE